MFVPIAIGIEFILISDFLAASCLNEDLLDFKMNRMNIRVKNAS